MVRYVSFLDHSIHSQVPLGLIDGVVKYIFFPFQRIGKVGNFTSSFTKVVVKHEEVQKSIVCFHLALTIRELRTSDFRPISLRDSIL